MSGTALGVVRSAFVTSLARYSRSWGIWALMLLAPIAARLWIGGNGDAHATIAINDKAPLMTSAMLGVSLGVVVSTLLLPVAFVYLRSSVTRRQPWQVEETTAAPRVAVTAGSFLADSVVMLAALLALTMAGIVIGVLADPPGGFHPLDLIFGLWVIAGPALLVVAAFRSVCDALPGTRHALGEILCLVLWVTVLAAPTANIGTQTGFVASMGDMAGFTAPLTASLQARPHDVRIGGGPAINGVIPLDVTAGLMSDGYLASRLAWVGIALAMVLVAGGIYRPHRLRDRARIMKQRRWRARPSPIRADIEAVPAPLSPHPFVGLVAAEFRLIGSGKLWRATALLVAIGGTVVDYRHAASPAALLLLIFGLTAQAARAEQPRLIQLTSTTMLGVGARRAAFVLAGTGWAVAMAVPAIVRALVSGSAGPLLLALSTGAAAAFVAAMLTSATRSAFAPRLMLLLAWYVWLST